MRNKTRSKMPPLRVPLTAAQRKALANREEPSAAALREMPEVDFDSAPIIGRGADGMKKVQEYMRANVGHPKKGSAPATTSPRSIRFSDATWAALERKAKKEGVSLHSLLRNVIVDWLSKAS